MNRILLVIIATLFISPVFAQLELEQHESNHVAGDIGAFELKYHVTVLNTSNTDQNVLVEREFIEGPDGTQNYFCWGVNCYPPNVSKSPNPEVIQAQGSNSSFVAYYNPNGTGDATLIKYTFSLDNDPSVNVSIDVHFNSVSSVSANGQPFVTFQAQPSITNGLTTFQYAGIIGSESKIQIRNLTGQLINETLLPGKNGALVFDASDLPKGIYMYSLVVDNKVATSKKLIIH